MSSESAVPDIRPDSYRPVTSTPDSKKETKCPFFKLLNKIWSAVKWVFHKIAGFFSPSPLKDLSKREIEIIQNAGNMTALKRPGEIPSDIRRRSVITAEALLDPEKKPRKKSTEPRSSTCGDLIEHKAREEKKEEEPLPEIRDPAMREFHETGQEFVGVIIDTVFDEKVKPKLSGCKEGLDAASKWIKFVADLAIKVGDKAAKPFFEKLKKYKVKETLEPGGKHLLDWLLQNGVKDTFETKLQERMKRKFEDEETLKLYTKPCVEWILHSEHDQPLATFYERAGIDVSKNESLIEKTIENALLILVEHKIKKYIDIIHEKLDDRLPDLVHQMMATNARNISDILLRRMIDLLENTKYRELSSDVIGLVCDQTHAVVAVEDAKKKTVKEEEELIERAEKAKDTKPKDGQEETKKRLETYLSQVRTYGEEPWKERVREQKGLRTYSEQSICLPEIRKLVQNPHTTKTEREDLEKQVYQDFANKVLPILFPKQHVQLPDGKVEEVDGLIFLLNQIVIPEEFQELLKEAMQIGKEIVAPKTQGVIKGAFETLWNIAYKRIEELILEDIVKKEINKAIVIGIKELYENVITPKLISKIMGNNALPAIQRALVKGMAKEVISKNRKNFISKFKALIKSNSSDVSAREALITTMCRELYESTKGVCKESKGNFEKISFDEYQKIVQPLVEEIERGILAYKELKEREGVEDVTQIVKEALEGYFTKIDHGKDPRLGEIAVNAALKIGKLSSTAENFEAWIKGFLSEKLTDVVHPFTESPDELMEILIKEIRESYLDKEKMKKLLFEKSEEVSIEDTSEKLKGETRKTAEFAYDMIFQNIENNHLGCVLGPVARFAIGSDASKLDETIAKVFHSLLGNKVMTQNLLVRAQALVIDALKESSEAIRNNGGMQPVMVKRLPTLVPQYLV